MRVYPSTRACGSFGRSVQIRKMEWRTMFLAMHEAAECSQWARPKENMTVDVAMKNERKVLEVGIDKGMKHGTKIKFAGEANQKPGMQPGDVIFVLNQKPHKTFKRKGMNLIMRKQITLKEVWYSPKSY